MKVHHAVFCVHGDNQERATSGLIHVANRN